MPDSARPRHLPLGGCRGRGRPRLGGRRKSSLPDARHLPRNRRLRFLARPGGLRDRRHPAYSRRLPTGGTGPRGTATSSSTSSLCIRMFWARSCRSSLTAAPPSVSATALKRRLARRLTLSVGSRTVPPHLSIRRCVAGGDPRYHSLLQCRHLCARHGETATRSLLAAADPGG